MLTSQLAAQNRSCSLTAVSIGTVAGFLESRGMAGLPGDRTAPLECFTVFVCFGWGGFGTKHQSQY